MSLGTTGPTRQGGQSSPVNKLMCCDSSPRAARIKKSLCCVAPKCDRWRHSSAAPLTNSRFTSPAVRETGESWPPDTSSSRARHDRSPHSRKQPKSARAGPSGRSRRVTSRGSTPPLGTGEKRRRDSWLILGGLGLQRPSVSFVLRRLGHRFHRDQVQIDVGGQFQSRSNRERHLFGQ